MNPIAMAVMIASLLGAFLWTARRRARLLQIGERTREDRFAPVTRRLGMLWKYALYQKKMRYYLTAGLAHQLIFLGFMVLLLRSIVLWGRGFDPSFNLWVLGPEPVAGVPLGAIYGFLKDVFATLVLVGVAVFVYYRVIKPQRRMTLGIEGLLILGIIAVMMLGDLMYDGAIGVLNHRYAEACGPRGGADYPAFCRGAELLVAPLGSPPAELAWHPYPEPVSSLFSVLLAGVGPGVLVVLAHVGFWTHATLVLVFLNILPYSKHFHIITALPNVYTTDLTHKGRLPPLASNTEALMGMVEKAMEQEDMAASRIGYARIQHFTWKDILDFYTCTECGRCSDNCPAFTTGKILSPKHFTLELRDHLYDRQDELAGLPGKPSGTIDRPAPPRPTNDPPADAEGGEAKAEPATEETEASRKAGELPFKQVDLVPNVIHEDVLWACTTCRACEEQCPVLITYVDKIVQMRRNLVMIRGEFPAELNKPFSGMESNGNPWNLSRMDRANWAEGLEISTLSEKPTADVLFWVGCAASYDDRAKKIARAMAQLLKRAQVDFAILGEEESCTGDPARRAGNEYLFSMLAETNVATLNGYRDQGGVKTIVTTCPHCFNTLRNEYPDFGGHYEVAHHTDFVLGLVAAGRLSPTRPVQARVAFHDSCYLGRYNDIYEPPREILRRIPGVELVEVENWSRHKGLCCGAGGAQMWMEEQNKDRVNVKRTKQLLATGAETLASACPFCMTMLTDGIKAEEKEEQIRNLDVIELLALSCGVDEGGKLEPVGDEAAPSVATQPAPAA